MTRSDPAQSEWTYEQALAISQLRKQFAQSLQEVKQDAEALARTAIPGHDKPKIDYGLCRLEAEWLAVLALIEHHADRADEITAPSERGAREVEP